ncbi:MAG: hypothetical protein FWE60_03010 [Oscillospiraceae bacterium]|nr:hypothetical protein [Oscillospiraceae bacterium]
MAKNNNGNNPAVSNPIGSNEPDTKIIETTTEVNHPVATRHPSKEGNFVSKQYMYIGPALPDSSLRANTVIRGSLDKIKALYKQEIAQYGGRLVQLIVPVEKLSSKRQELKTNGTLINSIYNEISAVISKNGALL